jgi:hypothetical protein
VPLADPERVRRGLLYFAFAGCIAFATLWLVAWLQPLLIERFAREALRTEITARTGERIDALTDARITGLALKALRRNDAEIARTRQALREGTPEQVDLFIAAILRADCPCRARLKETALGLTAAHLERLTDAKERLEALVASSYAQARSLLLRDIRIFAGTNALAFAILALVVWFRRQAGLQSLLPAVVLGGSVAIAGSAYLFNQDWLHTLLFSDYVGYGYSAWMLALVALLADIVFNHARVTTELVNAAGSALGYAIHAVPC